MAESKYTGELVEMTEQQKKAQKARNIAIAVLLLGFCVLVFVGTVAKLGSNLYERAL